MLKAEKSKREGRPRDSRSHQAQTPIRIKRWNLYEIVELSFSLQIIGGFFHFVDVGCVGLDLVDG